MVVLGTKEEIFPDIMSGMNTLRKDKTLYDVRILVKGQEILAHKSVLTPVSDYFKSLFLGPFKTDSAIVEVDFTTIALDVESAEAVIEYLYTGTIDIIEDNLEAILKLATFLLIKQLQNLCIKFMEQSRDLNSYLRYFVLAVDYMVSEAEEVAIKIVNSRFHDWFIFRESTKSLSVCHLKKLAKSYDIFQHCSKIDTLLFLVDWLLNGQTEEHETLACEIIDPKVVEDELSDDDQESDNEPQSDDEHQDKTRNVPQNDVVLRNGDKPQSNNDSDHNDELENEGDTQTSHDVSQKGIATPNKVEKDSESPIKAESQNEEEPMTDQDDDEEDYDDSEENERQNSLPMSNGIPQKIQVIHRKLESVNGCTQFKDKCKAVIDELVSNDTHMVKKVEECINEGDVGHLNRHVHVSDSQLNDVIESKDLSVRTHFEQTEEAGCLESQPGNSSKKIQGSVIENDKQADETYLSLKPNVADQLENENSVSKEGCSVGQVKDVDVTKDDAKDENENNVTTQSIQSAETEKQTEKSLEQTEDCDVEHVVFAVTPKKRLKHAERSDSIRSYDEIFDICVYNPEHKTWYYFGEGKNDGAFRKIGESKSSLFSSSWLNNFCTKDHLCLASPDKSSLYMYPLKPNDKRWGPSWDRISYEDIVRGFPDFERRTDVRFCCADGETIYMVVIKRISDYPESRLKFKCYKLSAERSSDSENSWPWESKSSWDFMFETRYVLKSEDYQLYCECNFDVYVSPENTVMLIAVISRFYLHTFFVDLKDKQAEIRYNFLEPGSSMLEGCIFHPRTDFWILFDEKRLAFVDENFLEPKHRYYRYMEVKKSLTIGYTGHHWVDHELPSDYKQTTCSKLIHSVSDSRSAWAFLSDGKFKTSLEEIRISRYGFLEFRQRTPPPFSEITLMACGMVRKKHLAHLKPMREFLQE